MKPADNMGKTGSPNTGGLKYQGQGSVGMRGGSSTPPMPRATCDNNRGMRKLKSNIPGHNSKMDY